MLVYFAYYASIMLDAFNCLLCQHNRPGPNIYTIYVPKLCEAQFGYF